jgi:hypothetical protein
VAQDEIRTAVVKPSPAVMIVWIAFIFMVMLEKQQLEDVSTFYMLNFQHF